jgi:Subtilase family
VASWTDTIEYLPTGEAVRPGQIMMRAEDVAAATVVNQGLELVDSGESGERLASLRHAADGGTLDVVVGLRQEGIWAQPNHVLFASCGGRTPWLEASPLHASAKRMAKVYATPLHASAGLGWAGCCCPPHPATGVPGEWDLTSLVYASPLHASPLHASGYITTGDRDSTAVPAAEGPEGAALPQESYPRGAFPVIAIIDTGFAGKYKPPLLRLEATEGGLGDIPDTDGDQFLDPVAGHGTFIAGIIKRLVPDALLRNIKLVGPCGDADEHSLATAIRELVASAERPPPDILNLSLAGYALEDMKDLALAIRLLQRVHGTVVVAAAGNDATCRPTYPAVLPGVVGVGAVDGEGRPAPFSNYGPWVRASSLGVDVVSCFFEWNGARPRPGEPVDRDDFSHAWATWSGTSFAAPHVAALIARRMIVDGGHSPGQVEDVLGGGAAVPSLGMRVMP